MSIRRKTILIFGATLLSLILALYGFSQLIFLNSFLQLEEKTVERNVGRALNGLNDELNVIVSTNQDWAHWTDTYNFVDDLNDNYRQGNTHDGIFTTYGLNVMLFVNSEGKITFGKGFDLINNTETPIPESLQPYLSRDGFLLNHFNSSGELDESAINGLILLPEGPMMIASSAILTTDMQGPSHGSLIWGRYLDAKEIQTISDKTRLSVNIRELDDTQAPPDYEMAGSALLGGQSNYIYPLEAQLVAGYALLNDIFGKPGLILRVDLPREIYSQGQASISYFIVSLIVAGVIFAAATLILLERTVLSRLADLNGAVSNIRISTDFSTRIAISGQDELSNLATTINQMLDALAHAHEKIGQTRDQALDALRLKAQIMANVSHDARTPLNIITLRTEMLQHGLYGPTTPQQNEMLDSVMMNANQLLFFINNLLDQAQLEAGKVKLDRVEIRPQEILTNLERSMGTLASKKGLKFMTEMSAPFPSILIGDPNRLNQILSNLVINAIKFTDHGTIDIRFFQPDPNHWAFDVADTGPGITKENQSRIFEAFWQVDGSSTRKVTRGVGLGLSIVTQLTTLMEGKISLKSEVGSGSTFTVILPLEAIQREYSNEQAVSAHN